jgi:hypothetical protein
MDRHTIALGFELTVLASTVASLVACVGLSGARRADDEPRESSWRARFGHPLVQLALVAGLVLVNQVLCHAYILRVHGGDASFVTRYLGRGWFAMASDEPLVRFVAAHVGRGAWLSPTVLRVQAFLELPFTLFAYLAVARMLGRDVYRTLLRWPLLWLASASFTLTFSLVELSLPNPWTSDDLVLRFVSLATTPLYVALVGRRASRGAAERPSGVLGLLSFFVGAGAIAALVLIAYDALLLYNLAHLATYRDALVLCTGLAGLTAWATPRIDGLGRRRARPSPSPSPAVEAMVSALSMFTIAFFVPSLSLRYWSAHTSAAVSGLLLIGGAAAVALVRAASRADGALAVARLVLGGLVAVLAGAFVARGVLVHASGMPELVLAELSLAFLTVAVVTYRAVEIALGGVCWAPHEAQTPVDEA